VITQVPMPQMGLEVVEGTIVSFHVDPGTRVNEGDPLLEVETDKAITDVVAPRDGVVLGFAVEVGDTVAIGAALAHLGDEGDEGDEAAGAPAAAEPAALVGAAAPSASAGAAHTREPAAEAPAPAGANGTASHGAHAIKAAPVARRAAERLGIELRAIAGTGPRGRITLGDVERAASDAVAPAGATGPASAGAAAPAGASAPASPERLEPMTATRRAIARRMIASQLIPQFALDREVDATWLLAQKTRLAAEGPAKVSVNDLLVQALAEAVVRHPDLAAAYVPGEDGGQPQLRRRDGVDVGLAVATDRGLLVPVLRRAHERTLGELALERARLMGAARSGRIDPAELSGATISLSSLAGFGVDRFNAMLNPGETAILAVGRTVERLVPRDRGVAVVPTMTLTLTLDHRVVDGAGGAAVLAELAALLEGGMQWRG
jgi:pyruvate dehydrogenase E2 component (dihydrolipoamide acetyltransferase)